MALFSQLLEELASNKDLAEKMAEVINKQVRFDLSKTDPSPQVKICICATTVVVLFAIDLFGKLC